MPCLGCYTCFKTDLTHCPHYKELKPLVEAILEADLLILESPVYVYHATGQMMSFLDHFGTWWVVHRPLAEMSRKQAVAISTAAGGGMKSTARDMADSLEMWGIRKVYRLGFGVQALKPDEIPQRILKSIHRKTDRLAKRIRANAGKQGCNGRAKKWFTLIFRPWNRTTATGKSEVGTAETDHGEACERSGFVFRKILKQFEIMT